MQELIITGIVITFIAVVIYMLRKLRNDFHKHCKDMQEMLMHPSSKRTYVDPDDKCGSNFAKYTTYASFYNDKDENDVS